MRQTFNSNLPAGIFLRGPSNTFTHTENKSERTNLLLEPPPVGQ